MPDRMRLGGGGRFERMKRGIMRGSPSISEARAEAIAAAAGRKKYGKERFQAMAATGLRRHYRVSDAYAAKKGR